jgi:hypothetical protein
VLLRTIDVASFACGATVSLSTTGSTPWGLAAGAGVGSAGQGYAGEGYGILWEEITQSGNQSLRRPVVVVLDPAGGVVQPPVPVAAAVPYPDFEERTPSLVWSGSTYLLATAFDRCGSPDPLCTSVTTVVTRLRPDGANSRVEVAATIPVSETDNVPRRPAIAHDDRGTLLVWAEGPRDATPSTIRGVALAADGTLAGPVQLLSTTAQPAGGVRVAATDLARVAVWAEDGDPGLPDEALGRSRLVFQILDESVGRHGDPVLLDSTRFSSHNVTPTVAIGRPRGLLHTWSARSQEGGREAAFIGLVGCDLPN